MKKDSQIKKEVNEAVVSEYQVKNGMHLIQQYSERIKELCTSHNVKSFFVFGSAAKGPFKSDSDFDFLVRFNTMSLEDYFENYIDLKFQLEELLNRKVDLLEEQTLQNPFLIESIEKNKILVYGS